MIGSLASAKSQATRAENNENWESYIKAQYKIAAHHKHNEDITEATKSYLIAIIHKIQGGSRYGFSRQDGGSARVDGLVEMQNDIDTIKSIYESIVEEYWREEFEFTIDQTWDFIRYEIQKKRKENKLLLNNYNARKYPSNISTYLIESGLNENQKDIRTIWLDDIRKRLDSKLHDWIQQNFNCDDYSYEIKNISKEHGIFAKKFFCHNIKREVDYVLEQEELDNILRLIKDCNSGILRRDTMFNESEMPRQTIREAVFDFVFFKESRSITKIIESWYSTHKEQRNCTLCNKNYKLVNLNESIYWGSDGVQNCCFRCPIKEKPTKRQLYFRIPKFVDICGFVPSKFASPATFSFTSRLPESEKPKVFQMYGQIGGIRYASDKFDSWFRALYETDALPDGFRYTGTGIWCISKDGHKCYSLAEKRIDDWLFENNIPHIREPNYPSHNKYNPNGNRRADWKVAENTFIEYFGMVGNDEYDKKIEQKKSLCNKLDITLIDIYPEDLNFLGRILSDLL